MDLMTLFFMAESRLGVVFHLIGWFEGLHPAVAQGLLLVLCLEVALRDADRPGRSGIEPGSPACRTCTHLLRQEWRGYF